MVSKYTPSHERSITKEDTFSSSETIQVSVMPFCWRWPLSLSKVTGGVAGEATDFPVLIWLYEGEAITEEESSDTVRRVDKIAFIRVELRLQSINKPLIQKGVST